MLYNPDYQTVSHKFDMKEIHEGEALKAFITEKTTIAALLRKSGITRSTLNWVIEKKELSPRDKMKVMKWIKSMWPNVNEGQVFSPDMSDKSNTQIGNNNAQAGQGSTLSTGSDSDRIKFLEKEIERLEELLASKDEIIDLLKGKHN